MKQVALVCVVLALVIAPCSLHDVEPSFQHQSCSASSSVKFVLTNRRNQTGHWTTEVKLKHDDDDDGPYEVDVEQKTSECDNSVDITAVVTASSKRPSVECARPTGYEMFEGVGYYKFHATPVIWNEARKTCEKEGAHLAIINSELESIVMKKLFGRHPNIEGVGDRYSASIGFHDHFAEGEYVTISGNSLESTGFHQWSTIGGNQPDNAGGEEDCGSVHTNGLLNDIRCSVKIPFICEWPLPRNC